MQPILSEISTVYFGGEAFAALGDHLETHNYSKIFVLVDENTRPHCLQTLKNEVSNVGSATVLEVVSGEVNKTLETCGKLWQELSDCDADRKSLVINLGGGVLTDMGGFVAATFKRGIHFVNIPTTLLSMVDASVGGKTGVDLGALKNQVGVFEQPQMVLVAPQFLKTLEQRQLNSGYAEMLKHGLILDRDYWELLKTKSATEDLAPQIHHSVALKNQVALADPTEKGLRKILNFGHTLGHAVESYFLESTIHPTLLHGEAIAVGMIMEAYLSYKLTGLSAEDLQDIRDTFLARYQKVSFIQEDIEAILKLLKFDKKNAHGNINFVLLETIGKAVYDIQVEEELLWESFAYYAE